MNEHRKEQMNKMMGHKESHFTDVKDLVQRLLW